MIAASLRFQKTCKEDSSTITIEIWSSNHFVLININTSWSLGEWECCGNTRWQASVSATKKEKKLIFFDHQLKMYISLPMPLLCQQLVLVLCFFISYRHTVSNQSPHILFGLFSKKTMCTCQNDTPSPYKTHTKVPFTLGNFWSQQKLLLSITAH